MLSMIENKEKIGMDNIKKAAKKTNCILKVY